MQKNLLFLTGAILLGLLTAVAGFWYAKIAAETELNFTNGMNSYL
jgi:hypothetical protein